MATLPDGRDVPDHYNDIGVMAPGGGTRGRTWPDPNQSPVTVALFGKTNADPMAVAAERVGLVAAGPISPTNFRMMSQRAIAYIRQGERPVVDLTPSPKPTPDPLDTPAYLRRNAPTTTNFPTDQSVRLANLARQRQARLQAEGFLGTGPESMSATDVTKVNVIGAPKSSKSPTAAGPGSKPAATMEELMRRHRPPGYYE